MILELAWKPLCVVIMSENSFAKSTLDASKYPAIKVGVEPSPGMVAEMYPVLSPTPALKVLFPALVKPSWFWKEATATFPKTMDVEVTCAGAPPVPGVLLSMINLKIKSAPISTD